MAEGLSVGPDPAVWARVFPRRRATAWVDDQETAPFPGQLATAAFFVAPEPSPEPFGPLDPTKVYRFVMGIDAEPSVMPPEQLASLNDPFASSLLRAGHFPMTITELLAALNQAEVAMSQSVFLISEAGQIPLDHVLERDLRYAIVRGPDATTADLLVSTSAVGDPSQGFLQVATWDDPAGLFNYYMRISGAWVWAGNSESALTEGSRGQGCFDSHVNGSVVMKELKVPWINWQSMAATILVANDDPIRQDPLYQQVTGAEFLEKIVRAGVARWTEARLSKAVAAATLNHPEWILRQLLTSTTVNLTSSDQASAALAGTPAASLVLPMGLWLNADLLLNALGIPANFPRPTVPASFYLDSLTTFDFAMTEGAFHQPGDTFFAFLVPETAMEDNQVVIGSLQAGLFSPRFAAAAAMVDFPNPVFSPARAGLMKYVPTQVSLASGRDISQTVADAIVAAAPGTAEGSPEKQFAANWALPDDQWAHTYATQIEAHMSAVSAHLTTQAGFDDYVRLAESRRREFQAMRLFEFTLTLPTTNIAANAPLLEMHLDGTVGPK